MVDKGLVRGMMLTQRHQQTSDACHLGKQRKKAHRKNLDRTTNRPNQVVYADLLIPSKNNRTRYEATLVVMDGYSTFVKVFLLTNKESPVVNKHLQEYILWAERQAGREVDGSVYSVKRVLTDKDGGFINRSTKNCGYDEDYDGASRISSESVAGGTTKCCIREKLSVQSRDPRSTLPDDVRNETGRRKFGSLAYVHVQVTSGRRKHDNNAKIGFVLGYEDDVVGCKVYFPEERTAKFVSDLRVTEDVVYKDRHEADVDENDLVSLHFTRCDNQDVNQESEHEMATSTAQSMFCELDSVRFTKLVGGEVDAEAGTELEKGVQQADTISRAPEIRNNEVASTGGFSREVLDVKSETFESESDAYCSKASRSEAVSCVRNLGASVPESDVASISGDQRAENSPEYQSAGDKQPDFVCSKENENADVESVAGTRGSSVADNDVEDEEEEGPIVDNDTTVASVFSFDEETISMENDNGSSGVGLEEDSEKTDVLSDRLSENQSAVVDNGNAQPVDAKALFTPTAAQGTGKRTHRDEARSEEARVEEEAAKPEAKRTRSGLREAHERRRPQHFDDFVMNTTISRVLGEHGRPIRACEAKVPRNRREALRSKWANYWLGAETEEVAALKVKGVIQEIPNEEIPGDAKPVSTMWVYALKSNHEGYVVTGLHVK